MSYIQPDKVNYLSMLRHLQRMLELNEIDVFFVCDKYQMMTDFCPFEGVLPAPFDCIVTYKPIKSWQSHRELQWFCRMKDEVNNRYVYFTALED